MCNHVTSDVIEAIKAHAAKAHPEECCGLLLGRAGRITHTVPTRNVHATPHTHFEIDPQALIDAYRVQREGGWELIGYYHSHPEGSPCPSTTDQAMSACDGKVWAICGAGDVRFWRDDATGFQALD